MLAWPGLAQLVNQVQHWNRSLNASPWRIPVCVCECECGWAQVHVQQQQRQQLQLPWLFPVQPAQSPVPSLFRVPPSLSPVPCSGARNTRAIELSRMTHGAASLLFDFSLVLCAYLRPGLRIGNRPRPAASCSPRGQSNRWCWTNAIEPWDWDQGQVNGNARMGMEGEGSTTVINSAHMHAEMISTATLHGER